MNKLFNIIIFFCLSGVACGNGTTNWDDIFKTLVPSDMQSAHVVQKDDLKIFMEYGRTPKASQSIYQDNLKYFEEGQTTSILQGDFDSDNRQEVVLACIDPSVGKSYIVILKKEASGFSLIQYFSFDAKIVLISTKSINGITLCFQAGTDWVRFIRWDGKKYALVEPSPYDP